MPWITAIVLLPLAGALSMLAVPEGARGRTQARAHALVVSAAALVLTCIAVGLIDRDLGTLQLVDHHGWAESLGLSWDVGVDGVSVWLLLLTTGLFFLAFVAAAIRLPERGRGFLALLLLAEAGLAGLFVAGDLVLFYVFWEAMLVPFYLLIGVWGGSDRGRATLTFVIYTMVGSLLMLVAIIAAAFIAQDHTGQLTFNIQELRGVAFTEGESTLLFAGFALAFAIKLPLWPFHAWLPLAYGQAPILVTGLLAAVMSKAGVYGLIRIGLPIFPDGADNFAVPLAILAIVGIVYGSLVAWRSPTMRMLVAYSSLAHLGFIVLGLIAFDTVAAQGAVLQMINHGLVVAAAFAIVGIISARTGREGVDDLSGMAAGAPRLAGVFLIVAMAALAVPGSNAFVGEFFILAGVFEHHIWMAVLASIGIVYAAVYMLRLYQTSMNGPVTGDGRRAELRGSDMLTLLPLTGLMLLLALWPASIAGSTRSSVERAIAPAQVAAGRPAAEVAAPVEVNPPEDHLPLTSQQGGTP
ncbi:MAG: NADH-quinone oxidoreductase subunit M [Actinomycetota bacterium]